MFHVELNIQDNRKEGGADMGYVTGTDSRQMMLGIWSIEDEVSQDSPARFIPSLPVRGSKNADIAMD